MGAYWGYPFVRKVGKYFLLDETHLEWSKKWFNKYGRISVFLARLVLAVRHVISIVAGAAKMNKFEFFLYTLIGGTLWNGFLLYLGIKLQENWTLIKQYSEPIDFAVIAILVIFVIGFVVHRLGNHSSK